MARKVTSVNLIASLDQNTAIFSVFRIIFIDVIGLPIIFIFTQPLILCTFSKTEECLFKTEIQILNFSFLTFYWAIGRLIISADYSISIMKKGNVPK